MNSLRRNVLPVFLAGMWIGFSEFLRNEILLKSHWVAHYQNMGLDFPDAPINTFIWVLWSFVLAGLIFSLRTRFSLLHTTLLAWVAGFVMMWLVIGNLNVLPMDLLAFAIPLSLLEVFVAAYICQQFIPANKE